MSDPRNRRPLPPSATGWALCACGVTVALYDGEPHPAHVGSRAHREGVMKRVTSTEPMTAAEARKAMRVW